MTINIENKYTVNTQPSYSAKNIKVLDESEVIDRFPWLRADEIARKYRKPVVWVRRGLYTCAALGIHENRYIRKYILKIEGEPEIEGFSEMYKEILKEDRDANFRR